ncbi:MAG: glycosyltransferase family 2 protein [Candidatus Omnitrophica bacterium]|nr:glycosyltransferase family 2 protein [Candidatus Omnitrophota bacterium]
MLLSIVIPCFNEKKLVKQVIGRVKEDRSFRKEIVIVDDCSTDGTREIIREQIEPLVDKVIYHEKNKGKGAALRSGFAQVSGDIVIVQDADLEYAPNEYGKLIQPILDGRADVVYGSRFKEKASYNKRISCWLLANKVLTALSNISTGFSLTDMETCYKAFKREVLKKVSIEEDGYGFEPEITVKIARLKYRIAEVAISYERRNYAQGKKIRWQDGAWALWCIMKYHFVR